MNVQSNSYFPTTDAPWTPEEHYLFLRAFTVFGTWWPKVAEEVGSRNAYQCRGYAIYLNQLGALPMVPQQQTVDMTAINQAGMIYTSVANSGTAATDHTSYNNTPYNNTPYNTPYNTPAKSGRTLALNTGRWNAYEHDLFLLGLKKFGHGNWGKTAELVGTRTAFQVSTHARHYFLKLKRNTLKSTGTKRKASVAPGPESTKKLAATSTSSSTTTTATSAVETNTAPPPLPIVYSTSSESQSVPTTLNISSPGSSMSAFSTAKTKPEENGEELIPPKVAPLKETETGDCPNLDLKLPSMKLEDDSNMSGSQKEEEPISNEIETNEESTKPDDPCLQATSSQGHLEKKRTMNPIRFMVYLLLAASTIVFWKFGMGKNIEYESRVDDSARGEIIIGDAIDGEAVVGGSGESKANDIIVEETATDVGSDL